MAVRTGECTWLCKPGGIHGSANLRVYMILQTGECTWLCKLGRVHGSANWGCTWLCKLGVYMALQTGDVHGSTNWGCTWLCKPESIYGSTNGGVFMALRTGEYI